jgi:hypothetical protein
MTLQPLYQLAGLACLLLVLWPSSVRAQYGDAYHKPDYARLQQMRNQRMEELARQHRRGPSAGSGSGTAVGSGAPGLSSSVNIWADYSRMERQQEAARRYQSMVDRDAARERKLDALIQQRGLLQRPDHHAELRTAALHAGYDEYTAGRIFGATPEDYAEKLVEEGRLPTPSAEGKRRHGWLKRVSSGDRPGIVYTGLWLNGVAIGRHTTRYPSGQMLIVDHDDAMRSVVQFVSGNRFVGLLDGNSMGRGRLVYADGEVFEGDFLDGRPHIGTWVEGGVTYTGERRGRQLVRGRLDKGSFIFEGVFDDESRPRSGQLTFPKEKRVLSGHFDAAMRRSGYAVNQQADGSFEELLLQDEQALGPLIRTSASGEVFTGSRAAPDQPLLGMLQARGAAPSAVRLAADGSLLPLPPEQHAEAQALAQQAAAALLPERARLRQLIEP